MPRDDSLTPRDLAGKLDVLAVACDKCGRSGRYRVTTLAETIGWDGKLTDWLYNLTKDCPRKRSPRARGPMRRTVPRSSQGDVARYASARMAAIAKIRAVLSRAAERLPWGRIKPISNGKNGDLQSTYEKNSTRAELFSFLILVGLGVEIAAVFILNKPLCEALLTIGSTSLILLGVWGEIFFERRARAAGDGIVAEAKARAAEAELRLIEFRRPRRALMTPDAQARMIAGLKQFSGTDFDIGSGQGDGEQADFVWDLEQMLRAAGWREVHWGVHGVGIAAIVRPGQPVLGIVAAQNVEIHLDPSGRAGLLPATNALISVLQEAGIEAHEATFNVHSSNVHAIHILVGPKR